MLPSRTMSMGPIAWSQQLLFARDAELMIDGHGQIFDCQRDRSLFRGGGISTIRKRCLSLSSSIATRQHDGEDFGPMVAPPVPLILGVRPNSEEIMMRSGIEQAVAIEIAPTWRSPDRTAAARRRDRS